MPQNLHPKFVWSLLSSTENETVCFVAAPKRSEFLTTYPPPGRACAYFLRFGKATPALILRGLPGLQLLAWCLSADGKKVLWQDLHWTRASVSNCAKACSLYFYITSAVCFVPTLPAFAPLMYYQPISIERLLILPDRNSVGFWDKAAFLSSGVVPVQPPTFSCMFSRGFPDCVCHTLVRYSIS